MLAMLTLSIALCLEIHATTVAYLVVDPLNFNFANRTTIRIPTSTMLPSPSVTLFKSQAVTKPPNDTDEQNLLSVVDKVFSIEIAVKIIGTLTVLSLLLVITIACKALYQKMKQRRRQVYPTNHFKLC